MNFIVRPAVPN
jgi:hypothetical protein